MDFTLKIYRELLESLLRQGFLFQTFAGFIKEPGDRVVILRHDVDRRPENALVFAEIERDFGIRGTYYFRIVSEAWDEEIIRKVYEMGHEVGYHYEDVERAAKKLKVQGSRFNVQGARFKVQSSRVRVQGSGFRVQGLRIGSGSEEIERRIAGEAIELFRENLERFRRVVPVKTICAHGSPLSRWDNRILWKYYDYKNFGITGEPYFDIDFSWVLYLTDTGRRWDGKEFNIRDKSFYYEELKVVENDPITEQVATRSKHTSTFPKFHSTSDIIKNAEAGLLPSKVMMTFHPQRWTDEFIPWAKELVWQNLKNVVKYLIVRHRLNIE